MKTKERASDDESALEGLSAMGETMKDNWFWVGKYLIVIAAALALGAVLSGLKPFQSVTLGSGGVTAGTCVRFIAHSGALVLLWALGYRCSGQLHRAGGQAAHLATTILALVTLIAVSSAYGVLLQFIAPFESPALRPVVDWIFIVGILSAAGWLLWALFVDSEAWIAAFGKLNQRRHLRGAQINERVGG